MGKVTAGDISAILETAGKLGVEAIDAKKRRQMDFATGQQQLQAQLGLAEKTAQQQYELARLNVLAQAATGKTGDKDKPKPWTIVLFAVPLVIVGVALYVSTRHIRE